MDTAAPVTVIGGGIVGICTALSLLESGCDVRIIERNSDYTGASYGNAGVISPWSVVPQNSTGLLKKLPGWVMKSDGPVSVRPGYLPKLLPWTWRFLKQGNPRAMAATSAAMQILTTHCIELYRRHLAGTGCEHLLQDSCYVHAFRRAELADVNAFEYQLRKQAGATIERLDKAALHSLEPALSGEFNAAILIQGQARALSPGALGVALRDKALSMGATLVHASVSRIHRNESAQWVIDTDQGQFNTGKIVVAAGAWSARLLAPLGIKLPLEAERGYHVSFPEAGLSLNNSILDTDHAMVASSMEQGLRVAGTAEFAGLDAPANEARANSLLKLAKRMLPDLQTENVEWWMGQRPSFPDSLPAIGELDGQPGLFAAFGHCHYGLMMAPQSGEIVAGMVTGKPHNHDLEALDPNRFN